MLYLVYTITDNELNNMKGNTYLKNKLFVLFNLFIFTVIISIIINIWLNQPNIELMLIVPVT